MLHTVSGISTQTLENVLVLFITQSLYMGIGVLLRQFNYSFIYLVNESLQKVKEKQQQQQIEDKSKEGEGCGRGQ